MAPFKRNDSVDNHLQKLPGSDLESKDQQEVEPYRRHGDETQHRFNLDAMRAALPVEILVPAPNREGQARLPLDSEDEAEGSQPDDSEQTPTANTARQPCNHLDHCPQCRARLLRHTDTPRSSVTPPESDSDLSRTVSKSDSTESPSTPSEAQTERSETSPESVFDESHLPEHLQVHPPETPPGSDSDGSSTPPESDSNASQINDESDGDGSQPTSPESGSDKPDVSERQSARPPGFQRAFVIDSHLVNLLFLVLPYINSAPDSYIRHQWMEVTFAIAQWFEPDMEREMDARVFRIELALLLRRFPAGVPVGCEVWWTFELMKLVLVHNLVQCATRTHNALDMLEDA